MGVEELTYTSSTGAVLHLNDGIRFVAEVPPRGIYGLATEPQIVRSPRKVPVGVYQVHNRIQRRIEIDIAVMGRTEADMLTALEVLKAALWEDVDADAQGVLTYTNANFVRRSIACAIADDAQGVQDWALGNRKLPATANVTLVFDCPGPTFYDPTLKSAAAAQFNGAVNVNVACTNAGNADAYPVITYTTTAIQDLTDPQVTDSYGNVLLIEATAAVSKDVVITSNPGGWSILYDAGTTKWSGLRALGSTLPFVAPGTNNLVFVATAGDNAAIAVEWYDRYSYFG